MRASLAFRLILLVGAPAVTLFLLVVILSSIRSREHVMAETEVSSLNLARYHAQRLETVLDRASVVAEMIATEMEISPKRNEEILNRYLGGVVASKDFIYGSCIAFEPFTFDPGKELVAPYFYWKDGRPEFVQLGNPEYNYPRWDWYRLPKQADRPLWSEPYFDEGGGETIMITYSVPFRKDGAFGGIATIDIAMSELTSEVEEIRVGKRGYAFVISQQGRFLAFPEKSQIMKRSLQEFDMALAQRMTAGQEGFVHARGPLRMESVWTAFAPIRAGNLSLAIVYPADEIMAGAFRLQRELLLLGGVGLLALCGAIIVIVRSISRPISQLAQAAQRVAGGDLDLEISHQTRTAEVRHLTDAFRKMTSDLKRRIEELRSATAARERIEGELQAARKIQMSILPRDIPVEAERREIRMHAHIQPAREVGGDFYDAHAVDEDSLAFWIGDVSGKGVPAALYMAVTTTLVKSHTAGHRSPAAVLSTVNRELCANRTTGMFVTLFYGLLNCRTGALVYCNAGHYAPFVVSRDGARRRLAGRGGMALGANVNARYNNHEVPLQPGEMVFCFTDGVTEALDARRAFYDEARLEEVLGKCAALDPAEVTRCVLDDLRAFTGSVEQADDITVLALRYCGTKANAAGNSPEADSERTAEIAPG